SAKATRSSSTPDRTGCGSRSGRRWEHNERQGVAESMAQKQPTPRFNPRGGERRGQRPLGGRPGSSLWYGLAFLLLLGLAQMYYLAPAGRPIPYSDFKDQLKTGQVAEVTVADQVIRGTLKQAAANDPKGSKSFTTTRVDDPKLTEELEERGAKYRAELCHAS